MKGPVLSAAAAQWVHLAFEWLALAGGVQLYRWQRRRARQPALLQPGSFAVVAGIASGFARRRGPVTIPLVPAPPSAA